MKRLVAKLFKPLQKPILRFLLLSFIFAFLGWLMYSLYPDRRGLVIVIFLGLVYLAICFDRFGALVFKTGRLKRWIDGQKRWRGGRPFWGFVFAFLGALLILLITYLFLPYAYFLTTVYFGFLSGGLLLLISGTALFYPQYSRLCGILSIFFALTALFSAFGGMVLGTMLGIFGGSLMAGWEKPKPKEVPPSPHPLPSDSTDRADLPPREG